MRTYLCEPSLTLLRVPGIAQPDSEGCHIVEGIFLIVITLVVAVALTRAVEWLTRPAATPDPGTRSLTGVTEAGTAIYASFVNTREQTLGAMEAMQALQALQGTLKRAAMNGQAYVVVSPGDWRGDARTRRAAIIALGTFLGMRVFSRPRRPECLVFAWSSAPRAGSPNVSDASDVSDASGTSGDKDGESDILRVLGRTLFAPDTGAVASEALVTARELRSLMFRDCGDDSASGRLRRACLASMAAEASQTIRAGIVDAIAEHRAATAAGKMAAAPLVVEAAIPARVSITFPGDAQEKRARVYSFSPRTLTHRCFREVGVDGILARALAPIPAIERGCSVTGYTAVEGRHSPEVVEAFAALLDAVYACRVRVSVVRADDDFYSLHFRAIAPVKNVIVASLVS